MTRRQNPFRTIVQIALVLTLAVGQQACGLYAGGLGPDCEEEPCEQPPPPEASGPNSYTCSCTCKPDARNREIRIMAGADDAEQNTGTGNVSLASATLDMPQVSHANLVGLRFPGIAIPPGSHIQSATVQFTSAADSSDPVLVSIAGEAADNAAPFAATSKNLGSRQFTNNSMPWNVPGWKKDAQGAQQLTPSLETIIQEIIDRPGWAEGNAIVLMIKENSSVGTRAAHSWDAQPQNAPLLTIKYDDPSDKSVGPQEMNVCMTEAMNPNFNHPEPMQDALQNDCQYRVGPTFAGLAGACGYPTNCGCVAVPNTKTYADKCDDTCIENPLAPDCKNFDPKNDVVEATNAPGNEPVCQANCPLTFSMFGRRSECLVEGTAHMSIAGEQVDPSVTGVVQFRGAACPEGNCPIGMEYDLDVDDVRFEKLFNSELFEELTGIGESAPGFEAVLGRRGDGVFAPGDLVTSMRGRRGRTQQALTVGNREPVNFNVKFDSEAPTCAIHGAMVTGKDAAGSPTMQLGLELHGTIVNQPPKADAGQDQTVQCPRPVVLDGSASSDLDGNIALYSWLRGGRAGHEVGFEERSTIEQRPGKESYILRVIDARGQADEDTTEVTVVDTTKPVVTCGVKNNTFTKPTNAMTDVGLTGTARDACEGILPVKVDVFSDEDDVARPREFAFSPDAQGFAPGSLKLRQERRSDGDGRVYLVRVAATDSSGNQGVDCCTVIMPQSSSRTSLLSAQKQANAARSYCLAHQGAAPTGFFPVGEEVKPVKR